MAPNFDMRVTTEGSKSIIGLVGDLDFHTARRLREQLLASHADGIHDVVLDMTELEFIDSSGLSVLVAGLKRLRDSGGSLTLRSVPDQTRRVLEVSGLSRVLSIA
ncbi:MAG TPA: STAS domain-containing protein [Actinomycetota bacterium]|nr:STAS domain-containing protein [Actinomycetota bacterium]